MKTEKQIIYDDENAAKFVENIKGWVDINNRFYGNNPDSEHMARWSSCTHKKCECGKLMAKGWTKCEDCREISDTEKYNKLPFRKWDGNEMVYSHLAEKYFHDESDIDDYCEENEVESNDLRLVFCEPNYFHEVSYDQWEDIMPEDVEEFPKKLQDALEAFNKVIAELPPASYSPGKTRTEYRSV